VAVKAPSLCIRSIKMLRKYAIREIMVKAGKRRRSYSGTGLDKRSPLICYFSPLAKLKASRGLAYNSTKQAETAQILQSRTDACHVLVLHTKEPCDMKAYFLVWLVHDIFTITCYHSDW
jgi:hypothetical protein